MLKDQSIALRFGLVWLIPVKVLKHHGPKQNS